VNFVAIGCVVVKFRSFAYLAIYLLLERSTTDNSNVRTTIWLCTVLMPSSKKYLNNPAKVAPLCIKSGSEEEIAAVVQEICTDIIQPPYKISQLSGGLSNQLYVVNDSVLVRVHAESGDSSNGDDSCTSRFHLVDRELESRVLAFLAQEGIAPIMYGRFQNGRLEEFLRGAEPLKCTEMAKYGALIAAELGGMHVLTLPDDIVLPSMIDRVEVWFDYILRQGDKNDPIFADLDVRGSLQNEFQWLKGLLQPPNEKSACSSALLPDQHDVSDRAITFSREVVFTHMDCQSLNILKLKPITTEDVKTDQFQTTGCRGLQLIDFEYASSNARAADIANTFCEHCDMNNLKADYKNEYPTDDDQNVFLKAYVQKVDPALALELEKENGQSWKDFVQVMRYEVGKHTLLSHLAWAIWSIVQHFVSPIEFDFKQYASQRLEGYRYFKDRFC